MRPASLKTAVAVAFVVFAASCASPEDPPASTTTPPAAGHGTYASCLTENGVSTPPAGPGAPPGVDAQTWAAAQKACADKAPGPVGRWVPDMERPPSLWFLVGRTEGLGGRVAAGNSPAHAG